MSKYSTKNFVRSVQISPTAINVNIILVGMSKKRVHMYTNGTYTINFDATFMDSIIANMLIKHNRD